MMLSKAVNVKNVKKNEKRDEIKSTPTLVINGEQHSNQSYEKLTKILDEILEKS